MLGPFNAILTDRASGIHPYHLKILVADQFTILKLCLTALGILPFVTIEDSFKKYNIE